MQNLRKIPFLFAVVLLSACSPQRKLANLLHRYPELQTDSTYYRFSVLDSVISKHTFADTVFWHLPDSGKSISVQAGKAKATLTNDSGKYKLSAEQIPDTVIIQITDSIPVPTYEYVEVVQKKPVPFIVKFFAVLGGFATLAVAGRVALKAFLRR